ncbi:magnesium ion transporter [Arachnomyces sp. PD_36]|nr:magnesium ion transporter [Arachnomyces sp. PD_36]
MISQPSLKPSIPSSTLLRFLRSQSENLCFSGSSPTAAYHCRQRRLLAPQSRNYSRWTDEGAVPRKATAQGSFPPSLVNRRKTPGALSSHNSLGLGSTRTRNSPTQQVQYSRSSSIGAKRHFLRGLLDFRHQKVESKLKPDDLPPLSPLLDDGSEGNLFNLGRTLAAKASNELRLRCTEFDGSGNVTLVNGEFRKSELIAKYGLLPRDLRKIDSSVLPHILVRPSAILISLLHLRVLIKSDRVLVFDAYGSADSYTQSVFMYDLEGKLQQKDPGSRQATSAGALPYEFRALEAVMISVTSGLEGEFEGVREPVVQVLRALEEDIDRDKLRHLLVYSKKLGTFEQKARLVRDAIDDLLEADDDLTAMYLTERSKGIQREEHDHQEVEMLLESYHKVCDEIVQASGNLVTNIRNTEEIVKAILDANRNSLMLLDLKFSIGTLGLATGTLFSALYGMNLKNFIEESDFGFGLVSASCFFFSALVCAYGLTKLRKVQRVRMWGEGTASRDSGIGTLGNLASGSDSIGSRGNWRSEAFEPMWRGGDKRIEKLKRFREGATVGAASGAQSSVRRDAALRRLSKPSPATRERESPVDQAVDARTSEEVTSAAASR